MNLYSFFQVTYHHTRFKLVTCSKWLLEKVCTGFGSFSTHLSWCEYNGSQAMRVWNAKSIDMYWRKGFIYRQAHTITKAKLFETLPPASSRYGYREFTLALKRFVWCVSKHVTFSAFSPLDTQCMIMEHAGRNLKVRLEWSLITTSRLIKRVKIYSQFERKFIFTVKCQHTFIKNERVSNLSTKQRLDQLEGAIECMFSKETSKLSTKLPVIRSWSAKYGAWQHSFPLLLFFLCAAIFKIP